MTRSALVRYIYTGAGMISIGFAIAGAVLPVVPTVPLVLLAGFFFSRSSEKFDSWLVEHRVFGPIIRDWRAGRGFTIRAKVGAVAAIVLSFTITLVVMLDSVATRVGMVALAATVIAYVVSRPTKPATNEAA